jgi:hypothetical protein
MPRVWVVGLGLYVRVVESTSGVLLGPLANESWLLGMSTHQRVWQRKGCGHLEYVLTNEGAQTLWSVYRVASGMRMELRQDPLSEVYQLCQLPPCKPPPLPRTGRNVHSKLQ